MSALLIIMAVVYFAILFMVVIRLCLGVVFNTWREVLRRDKE